MSKIRIKPTVVISRLAILVFVLFIASCREHAVSLPNGYTLVPKNENLFLIEYGNENVLIKESITQFCVYEGCIYGWIDNKKDDFFFVNTKTHELKLFDEWRQIDHFLINSGLPKLRMMDSFTYWDLANGLKKKTW